jgi:hypothetical protein
MNKLLYHIKGILLMFWQVIVWAITICLVVLPLALSSALENYWWCLLYAVIVPLVIIGYHGRWLLK